MSEGYIKLYRSLKDKGYYKNSKYVHLWIYLLLKASYTEIEYLFENKMYHLIPGQLITGRKIISKETGISETTIERILTCFENEQQIEQQKNNKFRIISILNWSMYQQDGQQNEQQTDNQRTSSGHLADTIKKEKKEKKENNKEIIYPEWLDLNLWKDFKEHRIKLRKPLTVRAEEILLTKLAAYKEQGYNPRNLIITAIERGWQSVFAPNN
jgi:uncharacterized protein (UPF0297 family)